MPECSARAQAAGTRPRVVQVVADAIRRHQPPTVVRADLVDGGSPAATGLIADGKPRASQ